MDLDLELFSGAAAACVCVAALLAPAALRGPRDVERALASLALPPPPQAQAQLPPGRRYVVRPGPGLGQLPGPAGRLARGLGNAVAARRLGWVSEAAAIMVASSSAAGPGAWTGEGAAAEAEAEAPPPPSQQQQQRASSPALRAPRGELDKVLRYVRLS